MPTNVPESLVVSGAVACMHELFIPVSDPDGNIGTDPAVVLLDGVDLTVYNQIPIPLELQQVVTAQVVIIPGGTGNMRRNVSTQFSKLGAAEAYNVHTGSIAAGEVALTINRRELVDILAALTLVLAGDLVGIAFTREGSHANDTIGASCYYLGIRIRYV